MMLSPKNANSLLRLAASAGGFALFLAAAQAQTPTPTLIPLPFVTTVAGVPAGSTNAQCSSSVDIPNTAGAHLGDGCLPTQANLVTLYGAFTDSVGNIYITENGTNNDIRVIYQGGSVLTQLLIASSAALTDFTPIPGHIYTLAGARASTLTKFSTKYTCNGVATGPVALDSAGDGCPGTQAYIKPRGMSVDANGNVFFVSTGGGNVVKVLYAGGTQVANLIVTENPGVTPQVGYVYQLAGQSSPSYNGDGGLAKAAALVVVRDIVVDPSGNLYISDGTSTATSGNTVRRIDGVSGIITTYAGGGGNCAEPSASCPEGESGDGGPATQALLDGPYNLFLDRFNNLYISEYSGNRVRVVYTGGTIPGIANPVAGNIYTYAGGGTSSTNGTLANQAKFGTVQVTGVDQAGNIYIEDGGSKNIWRFDANTGVGYIIAGRPSGSAPTAGNFCNGTSGPTSLDNFGDGCPGPAAALSDIGRISFDPQGNFYTGENGNGIVRRYSYNTQFPATNVGATSTQPLAFEALSPVTLATESFAMGQAAADYSDAGNGTCTATSTLAAAQVCVFNVNFMPAHDGAHPGAVQLSSAGTILSTSVLSGLGVAPDLAIDPYTQTAISSGITPVGIATDLRGDIFISDSAGNQVLAGATNPTSPGPLVTGLNKPSGLALDSLGTLYIVETGNNRVLTYPTHSTAGAVSTFASGLNAPQGVAIDAFDNVFIADTGNNRVVEVAPNGVQTVAPLAGLNAPTQLAFDANGDLFVVDSGNSRVVELPVFGNQTTVSLPGVTPTAVAVDPSGTIYVTDLTSQQLLAFAPGATTGTALLAGLIKPAALAVDADGNLYLADAGATSGTYLSRSLANVTFPITNVNQTSTASINLTNVGNAPLNFPSGNLFTLAGSQEFTLAPSTTNGCATGTAYAPATGCNFTASFAPTVKGVAGASATFNTNASNFAGAQLTGNGQQLVTTSSTIAVQSPTGAIVYGQPVVVAASVTPSSNAGAPTGTVIFTVDGRAQAPLAYGTGTYSLTLNPAVGTHTVSIAFSGDGLYASSSANASFTVGQAVTTTALTIAPQNMNGAVSLTFTATVASATASGETGSIAFYAGTQLLSTQLLSATRTSSYTTSTLSFGSNSFTAVYSGDANFAGSTSAVVAGSGDFAIGSSTPTVAIPQGGVAAVNFVIDALYGGTGTIAPTCSGLPANSLCRFEPTTITLNGNTAVQMEIYTNVNSNLASNSEPRRFSGEEIFLAALFPLGLLAFGRRFRRLRIASLLCFAMLAVTLPLSGCGKGSAAAISNENLVTPVGTSTITVTFAGASPLVTHTTSFSLTVVANP